MIDLDAIRHRHAAASASGPWQLQGFDRDDGYKSVLAHPDPEPSDPPDRESAEYDQWWDVVWMPWYKATVAVAEEVVEEHAEFIAHAPGDVGALLGVADAARHLCDEYAADHVPREEDGNEWCNECDRDWPCVFAALRAALGNGAT